MNARAIVFDLDETLYRERRFALGGYRAVAASVERDFSVSRQAAFGCLTHALRRGRRFAAFQELAARFDLPEASVADWVETYRCHQPALRLSAAVRRALERMRGTWRVGLLTNGLPSVQAAKVDALGVGDLVDAVVFADEFGGGKPAREAFLEIAGRLGVGPENSVFAGDDVRRDIEGARRAGMKTILVDRHYTDECANAARPDAIVRRPEDVPDVAEQLLARESLYVL
jgi:putative hydrolase of the HAD superfamily